MYINVYIYVYICINIYTYNIYTHIYIYIYTYIRRRCGRESSPWRRAAAWTAAAWSLPYVIHILNIRAYIYKHNIHYVFIIWLEKCVAITSGTELCGDFRCQIPKKTWISVYEKAPIVRSDKIVAWKWLSPRSEYGRDCLLCAELARQRFTAKAKGASDGTAAVRMWQI